MALIPSFSSSQPIGEPGVVTLEDTSTGSDVLITQRRVYLRVWDNTFLAPSGTTTDYIQWPLADLVIDISALSKDYGLTVTVQWLDVNGVMLYTSTQEIGFTSYNEDYDYGLTQLMAANPLLSDDNGFREHKSDMRDFIDSGDKAIQRASDTYNAQLCYDLATELRLNSKYYFNVDN